MDSIIPRVAILDIVQFVRPEIHICMRLATSMVSLIMVGGEITNALLRAWPQRKSLFEKIYFILFERRETKPSPSEYRA